jgi:hypothetical protein
MSWCTSITRVTGIFLQDYSQTQATAGAERKSTFINLDRIRWSVQEISKYTPTDEAVWRSIRDMTLQRLTRKLLWKCIHNTFRVGDFWSHIDTFENWGRCQVCQVSETLEHIALDCSALGQTLIWNRTQQLWCMKYLV